MRTRARPPIAVFSIHDRDSAEFGEFRPGPNPELSQAMHTHFPIVLFFLFTWIAPAAQRANQTVDPPAVPRVSIDEFKKLQAAGEVLVVDVRSEASFSEGHIPGALWVALGDIERRAGEVRKKARSRPIVTYCSCFAEHTAAEAASRLYAQGFSHVKALAGGYPEWVLRGWRVER
jgi:rhodanese-related sulfurtransferase